MDHRCRRTPGTSTASAVALGEVAASPFPAAALSVLCGRPSRHLRGLGHQRLDLLHQSVQITLSVERLRPLGRRG